MQLLIKILGRMANSIDPDQTAPDPDQTAPSGQSDLGLHCLPMPFC